MSALILAFICIAVLFFGYFFYGPSLSALFGVDKGRKTPALKRFDGVDYVPAFHWTVLFGHYFASIAGAAPDSGILWCE